MGHQTSLSVVLRCTSARCEWICSLIGDVCPGEWTKIFDPMQTRDETFPPWWGLVGVGRKLDGEAGNDFSLPFLRLSSSMNHVEECMGPDPGILRGRILARLRIRGMRRLNKTRRPKLRTHMLDSAGVACASWACISCNEHSFMSSCRGTFSMFLLVPGDNLVDSGYRRNQRLDGLLSWNPEAGWTIVLEPGGWLDYRPGTRRLVGLSSWNPEAGWTIVLQPGGWLDYRPGTRRLDGLSSWNPEAGWTIVLEPEGWMDYSPGTRRLVELLSRNPEMLLGPRGVVRIRRSFLDPGGRILEPARKTLNTEVDNRFGIRRLSKDLERFLLDPDVVLNPEVALDPEVVLNPEVSFGPGGRYEPGGCSRPEGRFEPVGCSRPGSRLGTRMFLQTLRSYLGPEGTIVRLPRQNYSRYLFGFRIQPFGSWPLSSSYAVFYFCRKSLTGLEGAGVGVITQVPCFAAFHVWRSRVLIAPWTPMRLRLHRGFSTLRLYLCLLRCCKNWHVSYDAPCVRYFALYGICSLPESKRVSSSGSTLHYKCFVSRMGAGMDAGVGAGASLNRNLEAGVLPEDWMIFPNQFTPYFSISSSNSGNNLCTQVNRSCSFSAGFPWAGHRSSNPSSPDLLRDDLARFRTLVSFHWMSRLILGARGLKKIQDPSLACRWMARLVRFAGEDHLYLLKSAVGDLLSRSRAGILDPGFALQTRRLHGDPKVLNNQEGPYSAFLGKTTPNTCLDFAFCRSEAGHYRVPMLYSTSAGRMDAGVGAGASLNRNLEAGVLPEAWMIFPN
ncbi:hypothetical protein DY000_02006609 [Brassica cretica]|uniref:Uncharacterized protein n=1 Tax=Brassica cretica TaxID=69181 RepID=A0ABQ7C0X0_BRACR|nr:hypothetical protein DY000_02006609 [Brassica cretica]